MRRSQKALLKQKRSELSVLFAVELILFVFGSESYHVNPWNKAVITSYLLLKENIYCNAGPALA